MDENAMRDIDILTGQPMLGDVEGEPLFVINLCAAMTPQNLDGQILPGLEHYKLYQVSRIEDGRRRYRLRLGFFTTEADAEDVLASVRKQFATAFTACLCDEDLKHASGYLKRSVQDLARTGRFKIKSRPAVVNDPMTKAPATSDTAIIRVLKPTTAPVIGTQANIHAASSATATTPTKQISKSSARNVIAPHAGLEPEFVWESEERPATVATSKRFTASPTPKPVAPTVTAHAAVTEARPVPVQSPSHPTAPASTANAGSLMRRAHALEALSTARGDRQLMATGKYPAQPINQPAGKTGSHQTQTIGAAAVPPTIAAVKPQTSSPVAHKAAPAIAASVNAQIQTKTAQPHVPQNKAVATKHAPALNVAHAPNASTGPLKLEAASVTSVAARAPVQKAAQPFHVGAGVEIPETNLSLAAMDAGPISIREAIATIDAPQASKTPAHAAAPTISPIVTAPAISKEDSHMADLMHARELAKQSQQWREQHGEVPTLDTTQTIRTLTKKEIDDTASEKWYIVQLAVSDQPVNLDTMPRLDIFEAYNLYSVATMAGDNIRHALRLGFFREEVSAHAVLGYLKTFFNDPTIERIADAEHDRFANSKANLAPRPENTPKLNGTVVDLEQKRPVMHSGIVPTVNSSVEREPVRKPAPKAMHRAATPATKVANAGAHTAARKPAIGKPKSGKSASQRDMLDEARALGFSETTIMRAQKSPSLLSRLVGKLTK